MRTRNALSAILAVLMLTAVLAGCGSNNGDRNLVYEDMKAEFEKAELFSANIGIISKTENNGTVSYGECGSGIIFDHKDGAYYALTAAHVVSKENAQLLVFTVNTELKSDDIPGVEFSVLSQDTYDSMYSAETLYISQKDDLAVIRFQTDEELHVIEIAETDPVINDRIMCVGNPQNEWFAVSYGTVTSGIEQYGEGSGFSSSAMKHSAYINLGSSGGAAINEQMKLVGVTPGASFSLDGKTFKYGVLIPVSEIRSCLDDWKQQQAGS